MFADIYATVDIETVHVYASIDTFKKNFIIACNLLFVFITKFITLFQHKTCITIDRHCETGGILTNSLKFCFYKSNYFLKYTRTDGTH